MKGRKMKAVRGSDRAATKAPRKQNQEKSKKTTAKRPAKEQESELREDGQKTQRNQAKKRTVPRAQETWKPISRSSIASVENAMDLAILGTLGLKKAEKKESQEHLNTIKKRFLADCAKLKVPPSRQKYPECSFQHHQEETKKLHAGKATLSAVEEDLKAVLEALEKTEEQMASLEKECSLLRDQVEQEEEKARRMLQKREHGVLHIRFQPPEKDEATLEAQMRKPWPEADAEATARKLGEILQTSEATQAAQELLLEAHRRADQLRHQAGESGSH